MMSISQKKTVEFIGYMVSTVATIVGCTWILFPAISGLILIIETLFLTAIGAFYLAYRLKQNFIESDNVTADIFKPSVIEDAKVEGEVTCHLPDKGAVHVTISVEMTKPVETSESDQVSPENLNVLVVDDNLTNQLLVCSSLEKLGCNISKAFNGVQAVKAVTKSSFDLILMDLKMPVMDGLDATKKIRQIDSLNINTPIVALTPTPESMNKKKCQNLGMNGCLAKPVSRKSMRRLLELLRKEEISWEEID